MIVLQELKTNNVLGGQSQWSTSSWACQCATHRLVLLDSRCCSLRVKLTFPMTVFLDNNLGQDSYTAFLSALNWVPDPDTFTGSSRCKWLKCYSLFQTFSWAHPGMPQNCHCTRGVRWSPIHICLPLSAPRRWWSLLPGTPVIKAGHNNSVALQAMQVDENGSWINLKCMTAIEQKT